MTRSEVRHIIRRYMRHLVRTLKRGDYHQKIRWSIMTSLKGDGK